MRKVIVRFNRSGNRSNDRAERTIRFCALSEKSFGTSEERDIRPLSIADQKVQGVIVRGNRSGIFRLCHFVG